jgi:hypothetical protein
MAHALAELGFLSGTALAPAELNIRPKHIGISFK